MFLIYILLAIIAIIVLWGIWIYNNLVGLRNRVKNAWSQIDVQLQRRNDLIPNLIETVKGYMSYEKGTLLSVTEARNQAESARKEIQKTGAPTEEGMATLMAAEKTLRSSMGSIFALAENYPDLKANTTMQRLQEELSTTENKVSFARQSYNDQVLSYNTAQQVFPANLFAQSFGHKPAELFDVESEEARKVPQVKF